MAMKTSERKNAKRIKALVALKQSDPARFDAEVERLFQAWSEEAWRRAKNHQLPPAGELIKIAGQYGLEEEMACEVVKAVECRMEGPGFPTRSVIRPKGVKQAEAVERWEEVWGTGRR